MDYQQELKELNTRITHCKTEINALAMRQDIDADNISRLADLYADINARFERVSILAYDRLETLNNRVAALERDLERRID